MSQPRIGIVGGGPGGLMTAYCLQHAAAAPYQLTLLEASDRLGGKLLTPRFASHSAVYEAGAAEFYDYTPVGPDPLKELVEDLGLAIRPMEGGGLIHRGRLLAQMDEVGEVLGAECARGLSEFHRRARDLMTPREFYEDDPGWLVGKAEPQTSFADWLRQQAPPEVGRLVEEMIHSDLATEPAQTGVAYGLQNYLMNDPAYLKLYSIEGGNEQLAGELARRIAAGFRLRERVTRVAAQAAGGWLVTSQRSEADRASAREVQSEFDYLVLALPSGALRTIDFAPAGLAAAMRAHDQRFHHPAHYLRITLLFARPFWRELLPESFCMLEAFGGCCLYDESARYPESEQGILGWLLGGESAVRQSELSDGELVELALASLPENLVRRKSDLLEARVHRWIGEVSAWPGGVPPLGLDARHQPAGREYPGLFVVGDYLFDSTLNGVLDSAGYVADWLAGEINLAAL